MKISNPKMSKSEILMLLNPYLPDFNRCIYESWDEWKNDLSLRFPQVTDRGFANILYELITNRAQNLFSKYSRDKIYLSKKNESLKITIDDQVIVRFKKYLPGKRTSNFPTRQALLFDAQMPLPGFGSIDRITVGYLPNFLRTDILGYITYPIGKNIYLWEEELPRVTNISLIPSQINPASPSTLPFRPKQLEIEDGKSQI